VYLNVERLKVDKLPVAEGGRKPPPFPSLFIKSSPCLAKYDEDVPIPKIAQGKNLDYEGELVSNNFQSRRSLLNIQRQW